MSMLLDSGPGPDTFHDCYRVGVECWNCHSPQPEAHPHKGETVENWCKDRPCDNCLCKTIGPQEP